MNEESENLDRSKKEINKDLVSKENDNLKSSSDINRIDDNFTKKASDLSLQNEYEIKPQFNDGRSIFIGNLNFKVTEKDLKDFFSKIGIVQYVKIPMKCGKPMGVAFVNFETPQSALEAIKIYNEKDLLGRKAYMRLASDPHPATPFTPKKSQSQKSHSKNDQQRHTDSKKHEKSKGDYKDDAPYRVVKCKQRPNIQYDYDYDYYGYYDYSDYDDKKRYGSRNYEQRRPSERYIEQYQRREDRYYYPPRQFESRTGHGYPYYFRPPIRNIGPNWY